MNFSREQLDALVAVVETGTFDAAARRLVVTPSAVSQRIKALEQQVGRVVVVRSKPARATESGQALIKLAHQQALLEHDVIRGLGLEAERDGDGHGDGRDAPVPSIPIAVNADSLASWILPAFARAASARRLVVDVYRDDQEHTAGLLSAGTVMAAVTSQAAPVPGCAVTRLGTMTYRAVATRAFADRWFPDGVDAAALAVAPVVDFDRKDVLQTRFLRSITRRELTPPRHYVPASADFARAVLLGLGWGMLPDAQAEAARAAGDIIDLGPSRAVDVPLYWQQWNLRSTLLDAIAHEVVTEARQALT